MRDHVVEFMCFGFNGGLNSVQQISSENITSRIDSMKPGPEKPKFNRNTLVAIRAYKDRNASPQFPKFQDRVSKKRSKRTQLSSLPSIDVRNIKFPVASFKENQNT